MTNARRALLLSICFSAVIVGVLIAVAEPGQGVTPQNKPSRGDASEFDSQFPIADYNEAEPADPRENADRKIKARKYNKADAALKPHLVKVAEHYHWPADFPALPVGQSDAVIVGAVSDAEAHLSSDKTGVFSEFNVKVEEVIKGDQNIAPDASMTLEREGGRVRFPTGQVSHLYVVGLGMPRPGRRDVFFLRRNPSVENSYFILTGYELHSGRVRPLDDSGVVPFEKYAGADETAFLNELRSLSKD